MRVLVNTKPMLGRKAGIGYYVQNLVEQLEKKNIDMVSSHRSEGLATGTRLKRLSGILKPALGPYYPHSTAAKIYNFFMDKYSVMNNESEKTEMFFDIYHETSHCILPNVFHEFKINNFIADIHDLSPIIYPELHLDSLVENVNRSLGKLLGADLFITKSQFIKKETSDYFGISIDKIEVVPNAPSFPYRYLGKNRTELHTHLSSQLPNFPDRPFILYTGTIEPRKNIETLIRAFSQFRYCGEFSLVLAGGFGWKYENIENLPRELGIEDRVFFLGYQPSEIFELLYNAAVCFVYPSFYEGFGMPNIEAMQCGVPVITSNASCLPEVVGDAALLFDPKQPSELVEQMNRLVDSCDLQEDLRDKGFIRGAEYSWEKIGEQIYQIYLKVIACENRFE